MMKTKHLLRAISTAAASLILISLTTFPGKTVKADPPSVIYEPVIAYRLTATDQEYRTLYTYGVCGNTLGMQTQTKMDDVWVDGNVFTLTWDEYCNLLSRFAYWPDWEYGERESWTYDCNGNYLTNIYEYANGDEWDYYSRSSYTYDGYGNLIEEIQEYWDGMWFNFYKYSRTYDENGNMLTELRQAGDPWEDNRLTTITYDGNGLMLSKLHQEWDGMAWYDLMLETWSYDESGNKLTYEGLYPLYEVGERETYTYDAAGNWLTLLEEFYEEGMWANSTRHTRQFDAYGNLLYYFTEDWRGGVINNWVNGYQEFYEYNGDGNCTLHYNQVWIWTYPDYLSGWWKNNEKVEYEYLPGLIRGYGYKGDNVGAWYATSVFMDLALNVNGTQQVVYSSSGKIVEVSYQANPTQLLADISPYQTVYYGYPPEACATVSVSATGGTPPYTYEWDNGEETASIEVCPIESSDYTVVITDAIGCQVQACTRVCVADVRCGNNMDKVMLCHCPPGNPNNCKTLCVSVEDVADHLAHGDLLGACGEDYTCTDLKTVPAGIVTIESEDEPFLKAYPNPASQSTMVSYLVDQPGEVTVSLANFLGQVINTLFEGYAPAGEIQDLQLNTGDLQPGVYVLIMQQADGNMITEKMVIQR